MIYIAQIIWPEIVSNLKQGEKTSLQAQSQASSGTKVVKITSLQKSGSCCAKIKIKSSPCMYALVCLIDTRLDITIMRRDLLLQASCLFWYQKVCTYDQKPITLDGWMEMEIFGETSIITIVHVCQITIAPDE